MEAVSEGRKAEENLMEWSTERPTKPGAYWWWNGVTTDAPMPVVLVRSPSGVLWWDTPGDLSNLHEELSGVFAGPIEPPPLPEQP